MSGSAEELSLLMDAKRRKWIVIESYNSHITPSGYSAYSSEKDSRDKISDASARKSKRGMKKKVSDVAVAILVAVITAAVGAIVAHWLQ